MSKMNTALTSGRINYVINHDGNESDRTRLFSYWSELQNAGLHKSSFHEGTLTSAEGFWKLSQDKDVQMFLVHDNHIHKDVGHFHLTGFQGLTAFVHFSILKPYHGKQAIAIAREAAAQLFRMVRPDGKGNYLPYLESLVGLTPTENRLACIFIRKVGYKVLGVIPKACYMKRTNSYCDGLVTTLKRGDV